MVRASMRGGRRPMRKRLRVLPVSPVFAHDVGMSAPASCEFRWPNVTYVGSAEPVTGRYRPLMPQPRPWACPIASHRQLAAASSSSPSRIAAVAPTAR
jgi:hypothetical protein